MKKNRDNRLTVLFTKNSKKQKNLQGKSLNQNQKILNIFIIPILPGK